MGTANDRRHDSGEPDRGPEDPRTPSRRFSDDAEWIATLIIELRRALRRANTGSPRIPSSVRTHSQAEVLRFLGRHPGAGTNEIADRLRLSANTVSALCSTLVKEGVLRRERDPHDRRAAQFFLGAEQQHVRHGKFDHRTQVVSAALDTMDAGSVNKLRHVLPALDELVDALEQAGR